MTLTANDVFALAEKRLAWINQRQGVLAQNIANANTPGYAAKDVTPFSDVLAAEAGRPAVSSVTAGSSVPKKDGAPAGQSLDGNAVVLDAQLEKVAETDTAQQLASNLLKKYAGLFRMAIGRS